MNEFLGHKILNVTFGELINQTVQRSINLKRVVSANFTQLFTMSLSIVPLWHSNPEHGNEIQAFFAQLVALELEPFNQEIPQGTFEGDAGTVSGTTAGKKELRALRSEVPVGQFISFSSHRKVYIVSAKTENTITVYPPLRENVSGAINVNPSMRVALEDVPTVSYASGRASPVVTLSEVI